MRGLCHAFTLPPGHARVDTLRFKAWLLPDIYPAVPAAPVAGLYRIVYYDVYKKRHAEDPPSDADNRLGQPLDERLRTSNTFRVIE